MISRLTVSRAAMRATRARLPAPATRARYSTAPAEYNPVPFSYRNRGALKYKVIAFFGLPAAVPFIATGYQLWKGGSFSKAT